MTSIYVTNFNIWNFIFSLILYNFPQNLHMDSFFFLFCLKNQSKLCNFFFGGGGGGWDTLWANSEVD